MWFFKSEFLADDNKSNENDKVRHAYSVLCADIQKFTENKDIKVLQLRNPWGFNLKDRVMISDLESSPLYQQRLLKFKSDVDKGLFWIDVHNYFKYFSQSDVCFSILGSTVHSIRFINKENDEDPGLDQIIMFLFKMKENLYSN